MRFYRGIVKKFLSDQPENCLALPDSTPDVSKSIKILKHKSELTIGVCVCVCMRVYLISRCVRI